MKTPLDIKKLQLLCEAVISDIKGYNEGTISKAKDESWAQLGHESLPALKTFIEELDMKLYQFTQNNSGGKFLCDDKVCHRVVIEAKNEQEATNKAKNLGIYFDGVEEGIDCACCGDRWCSPEVIDEITNWDDETQFGPMEYLQMLSTKYGWTNPDVRIFYHNGSIAEIYQGEVTKK